MNRDRWFGAVATLAAAVLWAWLAARTPTSTYHFAPLVVAGVWVAVNGMTDAGLTPRATVRVATAGFVVAAVVTLLLEAAGNLDGPVFWDKGDDAPVMIEHLVFAALGALAGAGIALHHAAKPAT